MNLWDGIIILRLTVHSTLIGTLTVISLVVQTVQSYVTLDWTKLTDDDDDDDVGNQYHPLKIAPLKDDVNQSLCFNNTTDQTIDICAKKK